MNRSIIHAFVLCFSAVAVVLLTGCSGDEGGSGSSGTTVAPAEQIVGRWTVDNDMTRKGWGDREAELERMMIDEMGMSIEFKPDNAIVISKNGGSGEGYWEIEETTDEMVSFIMGANKEAEKKVKVKVTFQGADQILYQSSETDFTEDLIFKRDSATE